MLLTRCQGYQVFSRHTAPNSCSLALEDIWLHLYHLTTSLVTFVVFPEAVPAGNSSPEPFPFLFRFPPCLAWKLTLVKVQLRRQATSKKRMTKLRNSNKQEGLCHLHKSGEIFCMFLSSLACSYAGLGAQGQLGNTRA